MSKIDSNVQPEFDFWEFVACSSCHLPFSTDAGGQPQVPFWITECGHVVCNHHLRPDQRCAECGAQGIQVAPLQREMDAPMSDWFRSAPQAMDAVAYSIRFQIETMASLVRYYKRKCSQQHSLLERAKADVQEKKLLRKQVEELQAENQHLRNYTGYGQYEPSETVNVNGKRRMTAINRHANGVHSDSSPRSITIAVGPDRLTLPVAQQHRTSSMRQQFNSDDSIYQHSQARYMSSHSVPRDRPGSSRFVEQFAYDPPPTQQLNQSAMPALSRTPGRLADQSNARKSSQANTNFQNSMMPPPSARKMMPPPPTPQLASGWTLRPAHLQHPSVDLMQPQANGSNRPTAATPLRKSGQTTSNANLNRFLPSLAQNQVPPQQKTSRPQRFVLPTASSNQTALPHPSSRNVNGSGQRTQFVPTPRGPK